MGRAVRGPGPDPARRARRDLTEWTTVGPTGLDADRTREDAMEEQHEDHGHSTAAWTGVGIILLGTAIAVVAVVIPSLVARHHRCRRHRDRCRRGQDMSMAGYGNDGHHAQGGLDRRRPRRDGRRHRRQELSAVPTVLDGIISGVREDLGRRRAALPLAELEARLAIGGARARPDAGHPVRRGRRRHRGGQAVEPEQGRARRDPRARPAGAVVCRRAERAPSACSPRSAGSPAASPTSTRCAPRSGLPCCARTSWSTPTR